MIAANAWTWAVRTANADSSPRNLDRAHLRHRKPERLDENLAAADIELTPEDLRYLCGCS